MNLFYHKYKLRRLISLASVVSLAGVQFVVLPVVVEATISPGSYSKIVYSVESNNDTPEVQEIYVLDTNSGHRIKLATSSSIYPTDPRWSPDGSKIAYTYAIDDNLEIYTMSADGSSQTRLTDNNVFDTDPQWSPDGSKIAYVSWLGDGGLNREIYVMDANGTSPTKLTNNSAFDIDPRWSPDGSKIAYVSTRDGQNEIYVVDADGSNLTRLTTDSANDEQPQWSPDGSKIAFESNRDDSGDDIYVIDVDGSNLTRLTSEHLFDGSARWSPDGSKIAFTSNRNGYFEIYTMNADGTSQTSVTATGVTAMPNTDPEWSPDGSQIVFRSNRDGQDYRDFYIMNADGSNQTRLTTDGDEFFYFGNWVSIPNQAPVAQNDTLTTSMNTVGMADVLANDGDEEAINPANVSISIEPNHGNASVDPTSGKISYTPDIDYVGSDQLTYKVCDVVELDQKCDTGALSITINEALPAPSVEIQKVGEVTFENGESKLITNSARPTFSGKATPGATVKVEIHSDPIVMTTLVDSEGNWSITPDVDLPPGEHTVYITAIKDGVTTELDSFVLGVAIESLPETGARLFSLESSGLLAFLTGLTLVLLQSWWLRQPTYEVRMAITKQAPSSQYSHHQVVSVPPLFPED